MSETAPSLTVVAPDTLKAPDARDTQPTLPMPDPEYVAPSAVWALIDITKGAWNRWRSLGKVGPQPIVLSTTCIRYRLAEIREWLAARKADGTLPDQAEWAAMRAAEQRRGRGR